MKKQAAYIFLALFAITGIVLVSSVNLDLNHDGKVNITDLQLLASHFQGKGSYNASYDLNNDSSVDLFDLVAVAKKVGTVANNGSGGGGNVAPLFSDNFESYAVGAQPSGSPWLSNGIFPGVNVTDTIAASGNKSLEFIFKGTSNCTDSTEEANFDLGQVYPNLWFDSWWYFPNGTDDLGSARYYNRDQAFCGSEGSNNNKFIDFWGTQLSNPGDSRAAYNYVLFCMQLWRENSNFISGIDLLLNQNYVIPDYNLVTNSTVGHWVRVRTYMKSSSGYGVHDGGFKLWVGNNLIWNITNEDTSYSTAYSLGMRYGYLMGWSNSGFNNETHVYLDNVSWYDQNPGW